MLRLYIDFKSPAAYLAMRPTLELIERMQPQVEWRAFNTVQQSMPRPVAAGAESETRGETHRRVRAMARRQTHLLYAGLQGLPMSFREEPGETKLALAVLQHPEILSVAFSTACFHAYWVEGRDLNAVAVVAELIAASGGNPALLEALDVEAVLEAARIQALDDGVVDAPAYVIGGEVFVGREHLPWIRSLLEGH